LLRLEPPRPDAARAPERVNSFAGEGRTGPPVADLGVTTAPSLRQEIKTFIVRRLRLSDVAPESIGDADPLFGGGLDLDSVDLLDLVVGVEKEYGIRIASAAEGKEILASVDSLAAYITRKRASA